ncbi:MAG: Alpha-L-fucosidase [Chthonomonadaceae bacterium]|nr:Alpha-L-fucosidase [Chthonomonadaceae bacterium]
MRFPKTFAPPTWRTIATLFLSVNALGICPSLSQANPPAPGSGNPSTPSPAQASKTDSADPHANETRAQRDARMHWWREARFGMFIHWGLYAELAGAYDGKQIGGYGEWIMRDANIPVDAYAAHAKQFDPEQFNADQWVSIAKAAGMKYMVITAKHHEGFAMFHTTVDSFNLYDATPFKRDPIAELAAACKKQGIKFGVYYSQNLDWHHPGGGTAGSAWDPNQKGDFDTYVKTVAAPQVKELIEHIHPAVLWWDIPGPFTAEEVRELTASFAQDPELIYNNRLGGGIPGDTETPEQFVPATGYPGRDWETCMTINDTWGFKSADTNFKSVDTLLRNLIDIASKGGNYLLNVGPSPQGVIPTPEVDRLKAMGAWLKVNGKSIYATTASPYRKLPFDGRATVKGNTLYLNVFTWPAGGLKLAGLQTPVRSAKALATGEKLSVTKAGDGSLMVGKPTRIDPLSTAIVLTLSGPPVVVEAETAIAPNAAGAFGLGAGDAVLQGDTIKEEGSGEGNIGYWMNAQDTVQWKVSVPQTAVGKYQAKLEYACEQGSEGSTFALQVDGAASGITGRIESTGGWGNYKTVTLPGTVTLSAGTHTLRVVPLTKPGLAVMNLKKIILTPAP